MREALQSHFNRLGFRPEASEFLLGIWDASQFFDDVKDGDTAENFNSVLWWCLVGQHLNPFFQANAAALIPVIGNAICKWHGANSVEEHTRNGNAYAWRAGYYDLVMAVAIVELGHEIAAEIAGDICMMYGETFQNYMDEANG